MTHGYGKLISDHRDPLNQSPHSPVCQHETTLLSCLFIKTDQIPLRREQTNAINTISTKNSLPTKTVSSTVPSTIEQKGVNSLQGSTTGGSAPTMTVAPITDILKRQLVSRTESVLARTRN